ncbi:MAG: PQQ-binding-like beta-propeller repeat protein, partial [Planctomycetes bacterium]|nr:PQQ-binding-like beta-propeller repeat protein [Planctomycetota bacterium]
MEWKVVVLVWTVGCLGSDLWVLSAQTDAAERPRYAFPLVDEVHRQSIEDFQRFAQEKNWSRAFRSIATQLVEPPVGLVEIGDQLAVSFREYLRDAIVALGPDARRAFRLFHDARAARELERVRTIASLAQRRAGLEGIAYSWFPTSSGDDAADELAGMWFEAGAYQKALTWWELVIEHHADSDLDRKQLWVNRHEAALRAGDLEAAARSAAYLEARFGEVQLVRGAFEGTVSAWLASLSSDENPILASRAARPSVPPTWTPSWKRSLRKLAESEPGVGTKLLNSFSRALGSSEPPSVGPAPIRPAPPCVVNDGRIFINERGLLLAIDAATGRRLWKAGDLLTDLQPLALARLDIDCVDEQLLVVGIAADAQDLAYLDVRDAEQGGMRWSTRNSKELAGYSLHSSPMVTGGCVYALVMKSGTGELELAAMALSDGALRWKIGIGFGAMSGNRMRFWMQDDSQQARPVLSADADEIQIMTDAGALVAVDQRGFVSWGLRYEPTQSGALANGYAPSSVLRIGPVLYARSARTRRLWAVDTSRRRVLW